MTDRTMETLTKPSTANTSTFAERAAALHARGFSLIPLAPRGKQPIAGLGVRSRTKDAERIAQWAEQFPDANVGVCADDQFLILDADDAAKVEEKVGRLRTYTVASSPGKAHYYFRRDGFPVRNLELGILGSLRAENEYVVGEGSIHPKTGEPYRVLNDAPVLTLPQGLYRELERLAAEAEREVARITANWDGVSKVPEGMRQYFLRSQAGKLWDGEISEEELYARLLELNQRFCDPPKPEGEVNRLVAWVMTKEPNTPAGVCVVGLKPASSLLTLRQLDEQIKTSKSAEELIKGMLPIRAVNIIGGDSGLGKSPQLCQMAVCVAAGIPFLGHPAKRNPVIIADYENDVALSGMLHSVALAVGVDESELEEWLFILQRPSAQELANAVATTGARLAIVDSLRGLDPMAENPKSPRGPQLISELQDIDCCWLLIHHLRKPAVNAEVKRPALDDDNLPVLTWLEQLAGARSLVNQTFTRIGIDRTDRQQAADLVLRGYFKGRGEFGPFYLERKYDGDGEPIGFEVLRGAALLSLTQKSNLRKVLATGASHSFEGLVAILEAKSTASRFLGACRSAGLVKTVGPRKGRVFEFQQPDEEGNQ